jgi:hypothetical protein
VVAHAETEHHAPAGELDGGAAYGEQAGVAVWRHRQVGEQPQAGGHRGGERQPDERVEGLVAAAGEPAGPGERVLGQRHAVEPGALGRGGDLAERPGVEHVVVGARHLRIGEEELHGPSAPVPHPGGRRPRGLIEASR